MVWHSTMCSSNAADDSKLYRELRDSCTVGLLRRRVWRLGLVTCDCRGILHNLFCGHCHPVRTAFSDTVILEV